jgi:hypothetical protein
LPLYFVFLCVLCVAFSSRTLRLNVFKN